MSLKTTFVALLRPKGALDTDCVCLAHGAVSYINADDCGLTYEEAVDLAEGEGLRCDYCKAEIVPEGVALTDEMLATIEEIHRVNSAARKAGR